MRQSQKQLVNTLEKLKEKITELDQQNAILKMQKQQINVDIRTLEQEIKKERKNSMNLLPKDATSGVPSHLSQYSGSGLDDLPEMETFAVLGVSSEQGLASTHSTRSIPMPVNKNGPVLHRVTTTPAAA